MKLYFSYGSAFAALEFLSLANCIEPTQAAISERTSNKNIAAHLLRVAVTCSKTNERKAGFDKYCFYDCAGSEKAIMIDGADLCPPTIDR
jgi:hypothetical protein